MTQNERFMDGSGSGGGIFWPLPLGAGSFVELHGE
jgi:hypothetical protein